MEEEPAERAEDIFADNSIKLRAVRKYTYFLAKKKTLRQNVKIARIDFSDTMHIKMIIEKEDDSHLVSMT